MALEQYAVPVKKLSKRRKVAIIVFSSLALILLISISLFFLAGDEERITAEDIPDIYEDLEEFEDLGIEEVIDDDDAVIVEIEDTVSPADFVAGDLTIANFRFCLDKKGIDCSDSFMPGDKVYALFDVGLDSVNSKVEFVEHYTIQGTGGVLFRTDENTKLDYSESVQKEDTYIVPVINTINTDFNDEFGTYTLEVEVTSAGIKKKGSARFGLKKQIRIENVEFCESIDEDFICINPKTEFNNSEDVFLKYTVKVPSENKKVLFTRSERVFNPEGGIDFDFDSDRDLKYDEPVEVDGVYSIVLTNHVILDSSDLPGKYIFEQVIISNSLEESIKPEFEVK